MSHVLNLFSYSFGFIGTIMIFLFGVPNVIDTGGQISIVCEQEDEDEKKKIVKYKCLGQIGLGLIALSFFLQIMGEFS